MDNQRVWKPLGEGSESRIVANPSGTAGEKTVSIRATDCEMTLEEARAFAAQILQAADGLERAAGQKDLHVQNRGGLQNRLRRWGFALVAAEVPVYFFVLTLSLFMGGLSRVIGVLIFVFMIVGVILLFFGQDLADRWRRGGKIDLADPEVSWNVMMGGLALLFAGMLLGIAAIFTSLPGAEQFWAFEKPLVLLCLGFCGAGTLAWVIGAPWHLLTPSPEEG
jgi:hypothetical protein